MEEEINTKIAEFDTRWKYHNTNVLLGIFIYLMFIAMFVFTIYTAVFYVSDNIFLIVGIQIAMMLLIRRLYKNIMPVKADRHQYINEYYNLQKVINSIQVKEHIKLMKSIKSHNSDDNKSINP